MYASRYARFLLLLAVVSAGAQAKTLLPCDYIATPSTPNLQSVIQDHARKIVCLDDGTYSLADALKVPDGTTLRGKTSASVREVTLDFTGDDGLQLGSGTEVDQLRIVGKGGAVTSYGIRIFDAHDVKVWQVRIFHVRIPVVIEGGQDIELISLSTTATNGLSGDGLAEPAIYISSDDTAGASVPSSDVSVQFGAFTGRDDGPGGDGGIAAYDAERVSVTSSFFKRSGAASVYFVNCHDCSVQDSVILHSDEYGIDIVCGSDDVNIANNIIKDSSGGAIDFDDRWAKGGAFTGNYVLDNDITGFGACSGLNVIAGPEVTYDVSGNTGQWNTCGLDFKPRPCPEPPAGIAVDGWAVPPDLMQLGGSGGTGST